MQRGFLIALVALGCAGGDPTAETPSDATRRQEAIRWSNRGSLYLQQGRPARAVAALERATRLDSTAGAAHFNLGLAHARLEQHPAAVAAFERALALQPDNPRVFFALGATLRSQHRYLEAAEHLARAIALVPDHAEYHFEFGQVRRATGDFAAARAAAAAPPRRPCAAA
ncbi:tetratricopeptide repeat protein, partial [bacterium]|nr:tetratricopeptide repeat protein [bacterium]